MRLILLTSALFMTASAAVAQHTPTEPIQVYTECIGQKADGTYFAWFGYTNPNVFRNGDGSLAVDGNGDPVTIEIPVGFPNGYNDSRNEYGNDHGQNTTFKPSRNRFSHRLEFTGNEPFMRSGTVNKKKVKYSHWWLKTPGQSRFRTSAFYTQTFGPTADSECLYDSFADVSLEFELSDPSPEVGQATEGTVTITNSGTIAATTLHVQHHLPDGVSYALASGSGGAPNPSLGFIDPVHGWTIESLAPGASATMRVVMSASQEGSYSGFFEVECEDQDDLDSRPADQDPQEDDYAAVSFTTVSASSGNDGGLESDGALATVIARRDVSRMLARAQNARRAPAPLVMLSAAPQARTASSYTSDLDMRSLIPTEGPGASTAYVTTPEDLLQITNAQAILAADYLQEDGDRVGAMLAVLTPPGETYDHTKAICDRVKGSRLESVRTLDADGGRYVLLQVARPDGSVDYAISVVAYPTAEGYTLDSRFRAEEYEIEPGQAADVLNVQTWASTPEAALALVRGLVRQLDAHAPLEYRNWGLTMPAVPAVFVKGGEYVPGRLVLDVANTTGEPQTVRLSGTTTDVEQGERAEFERTLTVPAAGLQATVETGAIFDAGFSVVAGDEVNDFVYLADGVWTFTSGDAADDLDYAVAASGLEAGHNRRPVERDARLAGATATWAGLFRSINPGSRPADLTAYSSLAFQARGAGRVQVVVEKVSTNGVEPFHTWIDLGDDLQTFTIPFAELERAGDQGGFTAQDVTLVAFYTYDDGGQPGVFEIDVRDMRFENTRSVSTEDGEKIELGLSVAPNPSRGDARVRVELPAAGDVSVEVYDLLGRRVATLTQGSRGAGVHTLDLPASVAAGTYLVRLRAGGEQRVERITRLP